MNAFACIYAASALWLAWEVYRAPILPDPPFELALDAIERRDNPDALAVISPLHSQPNTPGAQ